MERRQAYDQGTIERLHNQLAFLRQNGNSRDYEIRIDQLTVVPRTDNPDVFFSYEACLSEWTQELAVWIYKGASRVAEKYVFVLRESHNQTTGYTQAQVDALITRAKRDYLHGQEVSELRQKVKRQKKTIKALKQALETRPENPDQVTHLLSSIGNSNLLAGILGKEQQPQDQKASSEQPTINGLDNAQIISVLEYYRQKLDEETFQAVLGTVLTLAQQPELIQPVRAFIQQHNRNENKEN